MDCDICGGLSWIRLRGVISPWIRELGVTNSRLTTLRKCLSCNFALFEKPYDASGMSALYSGYRGTKYTNVRKKWEPWYTEQYNSGHDSEVWLDSRVRAIRTFLDDFDFDKTHIVDIGGDTGEIPRRLGVQSFEVREISDRVRHPNLVSSQPTTQLAICCHVLEHVAEPVKFLREALNEFGLVYIEVPFGVPQVSYLRRSRLFQAVASLCSLNPSLWRYLTKPATGRGITSSMLRQSEHLTFWEQDHFEKLGKKLNAESRSTVSSIRTPDGSSMRIIQALFSKPQAEHE